jgi:hypothetical protein
MLGAPVQRRGRRTSGSLMLLQSLCGDCVRQLKVVEEKGGDAQDSIEFRKTNEGGHPHEEAYLSQNASQSVSAL